MKKKEIRATIERYNKRLDQFGVSEQALGWGDKGRSKLRYEMLLSQWNFNQASVLDAGCGFGDLYDYMRRKGIINFRYHGMDINEGFIRVAKEKYGNTAVFSVKNMLEADEKDRVDFVLSSGAFNHQLDDNMGFINSALEKFNALSKLGFAANFLSDKVSYRKDDTYHADPSQILALAYQYSNNVVLRNDYMPFEFTVFVNKFSAINVKRTVYNEFVKYG